ARVPSGRGAGETVATGSPSGPTVTWTVSPVTRVRSKPSVPATGVSAGVCGCAAAGTAGSNPTAANTASNERRNERRVDGATGGYLRGCGPLLSYRAHPRLVNA